MSRTDTTAAPFGFCMNTSTIKGTLEEKIALVSTAGYQGIEPWVREVDDYVTRGGSLASLKKLFEDAGLEVVSLIAFFEWAVDDESRRNAGFEEARRVMDMAFQLGCGRIAAPPSGLVDVEPLDVGGVAERYRALLELGTQFGVVPVLEFWGIAKSLGCLSEAAAVAMETGRDDACILIDIFHMYKHGSPFEGLSMIEGTGVGLVHMNDYPSDPPRNTIKDAQRVFPGDGVAPLDSILGTLYRNGYRGMLSLELFNEDYYALEQATVAEVGLQKMQDAVSLAMGRAKGT